MDRARSRNLLSLPKELVRVQRIPYMEWTVDRAGLGQSDSASQTQPVTPVSIPCRLVTCSTFDLVSQGLNLLTDQMLVSDAKGSRAVKFHSPDYRSRCICAHFAGPGKQPHATWKTESGERKSGESGGASYQLISKLAHTHTQSLQMSRGLAWLGNFDSWSANGVGP